MSSRASSWRLRRIERFAVQLLAIAADEEFIPNQDWHAHETVFVDQVGARLLLRDHIPLAIETNDLLPDLDQEPPRVTGQRERPGLVHAMRVDRPPFEADAPLRESLSRLC